MFRNIKFSMNINQLIKGIIIGIAKIIPGLSGAVLMISFNLYDRAIESITCFFSNPKKNFIFLANLGLGIILGIVLFSKILVFFITNYYLYTTSLFLGLIAGGLPVIYKKVPKRLNYLILVLISFALIFSLSFLSNDNDYVLKNTYIDLIFFFMAGILEAVGTVIPGISSTALLMLMGVYNHYLVILSGLLNISYLYDTLRFIIPFSIGMIMGIIIISIIINYLFKYFKEITFSLILGIAIASIVMLGKQMVPFIKNFNQLLIAFLFLFLGYIITNKIIKDN